MKNYKKRSNKNNNTIDIISNFSVDKLSNLDLEDDKFKLPYI
jgi:hypothetical protein